MGVRAGSPSRATNTAPPATAKSYPEKDWYGGFAPRLGAVYSLNDKTVLRGGWGIFYTQAFYPGWGGGMSQAGFSNDASISSSLGGIQPAMYLNQGFPVGNFDPPPDIRSDYLNGQDILYRPIEANKRPVLAPVEHHGGSRAGPPTVAEPGLRRQRRPPAALEQRAAERHRSEPPLAW